jgi:hypothetical protein
MAYIYPCTEVSCTFSVEEGYGLGGCVVLVGEAAVPPNGREGSLKSTAGWHLQLAIIDRLYQHEREKVFIHPG